MDIGAMKTDLARCLAMLPPGMVNPPAIAEWIGKHREKLQDMIPDVIEILKPHVMAGVMEATCGALDTDEVERACIETLLSFGVSIPNENPGQTG
jgi:hypothetical protein